MVRVLCIICKSNQDGLPNILNHALRCCCNVRNPMDVHILELHNNTNVNFVDTRRKRQILRCIWRNIKKGVIDIATPSCKTRNNVAPTIYLPIPRTEIIKKSVFYYGATLWINLPTEIRYI